MGEFALFALIFTFIFLAHTPLLRLPYFWDEAGHYVPAARDLMLTGDVIPTSTVSNAHPPLPMAYLALWWKLSNYSPAVTRTAMLLVAAFGLLQLFRLSQKLANTAVAAAATLATALYPVFFAQSSMALADLPAAALTFWGLRYYFEQRRRAAAIAFCVAVLAKETAIATPLALMAWELAQPWFGRRWPQIGVTKRGWRSSLIWLTPLLPLAAWFAYHDARTGYVFGNPEFFRYNVAATLQPLRIGIAFLKRLWQLFGHMNLFVLTAAGLLAMMFPARPLSPTDPTLRPRIALSAQLAILFIALAHAGMHSLIGGAVLARYMLPAVPLVILIWVATLWRRVDLWQVAVLAVCICFVLALVFYPPFRFAPEDNLAYRDYVTMHQQAARFVEARYPQARVLTAWPASDELTKPYLGYVQKSIPVVRVENFTLEQVQMAAANSEYDVAFLFSTKYEPPHPLLPRLLFWEKANRAYFDYHADLPAEVIARMLGGTIVHRDARAGQWVAIVEIPRARNAALRLAR